MITFVAGSRTGASGPQTLTANSDVELDQPACKQLSVRSKVNEEV